MQPHYDRSVQNVEGDDGDSCPYRDRGFVSN